MSTVMYANTAAELAAVLARAPVTQNRGVSA